MTDPVRELFDDFRHDHEVLGHGLHDIATALRSARDEDAADAARRLDLAAGAHIAFEQSHFYPELRKLIGAQEVDRFEDEHARGLAAIVRLGGIGPGQELSAAERAELLAQIETMQVHTDECGEHFGALGRIPRERQAELLAALRDLREQAPRWTALVPDRTAG
ncbi:hemerythrin domain-containing protein [Erythrobacter sp. AP23]|uniref:hemerythrin domain-containing protein n=1 Tax=Erythrobacter sp. AP23 TaxID=499656 RepID=UPI00076BD730|nr:hemerythrin domain-containing protein [Erythrobacter sp. AP23]KWV94629.1 hypothetical protein ASS64_08585 [Erythrobacter sp. AP23]